ncbi:MAG TPA: DNA translocase FtsK [Ktedonobacteraceae bacterium]|nr:DNA translocase FtsK [Ktedonobacteraceae bacterium]
MAGEQTASKLIAAAILQYIQDNNIRFGVLARNLPSFDLVTLCSEFKTALGQRELLLALLGFEASQIAGYPQIATTVELAIEWRNDPSINIPIVVILNPQKTQEKIHSLELFELFKDVDLKRYVCIHGADISSGDQKAIWKVLNLSRLSRSIPLVAAQVIAFYTMLQQKTACSDALPYLGLLRDTEISDFTGDQGELIKRLQENRRLVQDLLSLTKQDYRKLARAFESDKIDQHRRTFLHIQAYIQDPKLEYLEKLTMGEVKSLFDAPKTSTGPSPIRSKPTSTKSSQRKPRTPDEYVIEQLLENDPEHTQDVEDLIQSRIRIFRETPDSNQDFAENASDIPPTKVVSDDQELEFPLPLDEQKKHPLEDLMRIWVQTDHWGGLIRGNPPIDSQAPLARIFDGSVVLHFKPLQPLRKSDPQDKYPNLIELFKVLDGVTEFAEQQDRSLEDLLRTFYEQRRELAAYRTLFLYDPIVATINNRIFTLADDYVKTYDQLANRLQRIYSRAAERLHDTIELATAQFLALDVVIIDRPKKEAALLTTLHPLHLWKWVELARRLKKNTETFNMTEQTTIIESAKNIPTILNTLLLHTKMFQPARHLDETHLVFAGEIRNFAMDGTVGIPYYEPIARQSATPDGLDKLEALIRNFLALYPPARLGLTIALIDPPTLLPILKSLASLRFDSTGSITILHGARIIVYRTDPQSPAHDLWSLADEEILALFRQNPLWTFHVDLVHRDYAQICSHIQEKTPHITILCDPSTAVVQPVLHTSREQPNPFVIPLQVAYDPFRDTVQFIQSPANGVFDAYLNIRNQLTGGLSRLTFGVGNKPEIEDQHLKILAEASQWLIIIDRPHGTAELSSLGQRIAWFSTNSRTLSVHTQDKARWSEHLEDHLQSLSIKVDWKLLEEYLPDILTIFPNGLLSTIDEIPEEESKAGHKTIRKNSVEKLLSLITTLHWYRQNNQATILLDITSDHFRDWFDNEQSYPSKAVDYFLALWHQQGSLYMDLIAITAAVASPPPLSEDRPYFVHLRHFAKTLEPLFVPEANQSLLAPMRREKLREALSESIFAPSLQSISSEQQEARTKIKAGWTTIINNLFSDYRPQIRLRSIRVSLQKVERPIIESLGADIYQEDIITLPGTLLQEALEAKSSTRPNTHFTEGLVPPILQEQEPLNTSTAEVMRASAGSANSEQKEEASSQEENALQEEEISHQAERLRRALIDYGIAIAGVNIERTQIGPRIIRYWVKLQPPAGRLAEVQKFAVDLARELSSKSVPIIDNIPGEAYIGIDLARENPQIVPFEPALNELPTVQLDKLIIAIGMNPSGERVQCDLVRLPHMLVAGSTGSGKTMFLSTLIMSLVWRHGPKDLELLLVDPKQTDFVIFGQLPHLREKRIIQDPAEAIAALKTLTEIEKQRRTDLLQKARCPNILEYNRRNPEKRLSWIVIAVDEFADIILTLSRNDREVFERQIGRLAATGRSIGIHLVLATQRPTTDVITGAIKANIPARISFRLPSVVDSRTILDYTGAEHLLGQGDMLASLNGGEMQRLQGYYASYEELEQLLNNINREAR